MSLLCVWKAGTALTRGYHVGTPGYSSANLRCSKRLVTSELGHPACVNQESTPVSSNNFYTFVSDTPMSPKIENQIATWLSYMLR